VNTTTYDADTVAINTIRGLCMDAIQKANSGHPGTPMGVAPVAYTLWQRFLRFDPDDPIWPNRDRFVLSEGHASALLWSLLYLAGVRAVDPDYEVLDRASVSLEDLKTFRQLGSRCPGHPEYRWTSGVETTTGPLGQGVATSVGMAIASRWLAERYNRDEFTMFDFDVYAMAGDGCMMEGVSAEAASLAAHLRLANLCWIYDSNRVTIEGHTDIAFTEDVAARFIAYGWNITTVADANDTESIARALHTFKAEKERPTLVVVHSHIGYGSPVEDSPKAHGEPLGVEGVRAAKRFFGLPEDSDFYVADGVRETFAAGVGARGREAREAWEAMFERYRKEFPELADEIERIQRRDLPDGWEKALTAFPPDAKGLATRDSSGRVLNAVAQVVPWLVGGSADLAPSTKTRLVFDGAGDLQPGQHGGRNLHFGVREHASAAIANGMALTKLRPYWSGFLIFSDYARGAIRLSALMEIPVLHIFTHDSIGVGEDGPTHQPVEQLISLRAIPGLLVFRPADANEVVEVWRAGPVPAGPADAGPDQLRGGVRSGQGRLRAGRGGQRDTGRHLARHGVRGAPGAGRAGGTRGRRGWRPRGQHALLGAVRPPARAVPRRGAPPVGTGARRGRAGVDPRLGPLRGRRRHRDRDAHLRGVGAAEATARQVRLHPGPGSAGRARSPGRGPPVTAPPGRAGAQAGSCSRTRWLITVDTPSPRIVTP